MTSLAAAHDLPLAPSRSESTARFAVVLAVLLGVAHAITDATTVTAVFRAAHLHAATREQAFAMVITYNLLAFALQPLVGWVTDRWLSARLVTSTGLVLSLGGLLLHPFEPISTVALVGVGNACFHVGAGARVLRLGLERTLPAGLFVAPGALGLGFGMWYGNALAAGPAWPLAFAALGAIVLSTLARDAEPIAPRTEAAPDLTTRAVIAVLVLLMISVGVRSLVGFAATRGVPREALLLLGLPAIPFVAFAGKALGGFVADRLGWLESTVGALLIATPIIVWGAGSPALLLIGLLIFQTTMPVTLVGVARALPGRPAIAFGWPCLALVLGALPTMFTTTAPLVVRPALLGWLGLALVSVVGGLWLLGLRSRWATPPPTRGISPRGCNEP